MAADLHAMMQPEDLFRLARGRAYCQVIHRVDQLRTPSAEQSALRVFALLRSGDFELAFERLAQLVEQGNRHGQANGALHRWARLWRSGRMTLDPFLLELEAFYKTWDAKGFWRAVTRGLAGRELEFIAALVPGHENAVRLLIGVADAFKLRGDSESALQVYLAMCRLRPTPPLLENVFAMAIKAQPGIVPHLVHEFIS
jgi:hypothetical protein